MNPPPATPAPPALWPPGDWFVDLVHQADLTAFCKDRVLARGQTRFQAYEIFENRLWGRLLILDGRLQGAEKDEYIYHEALVHPAMLAHPEPQRVLILGGGEGATLREALRHPTVADAVMVDIDGDLVEVCRQWLPSFHAGALDDPRARLVVDDGRAWLAQAPDAAFDVIILDLPEPLEEGPALMLFTQEMYDLVKRKLAPGGLMAAQSGSAGPQARLMPDLNATLRAVFPQVAAYTAFVGSFMDLYGFQVAGGDGLIWPGAARLAQRLAARGLEGLRWFSAAFGAALPYLPAGLERRLRQEGRVLTDAAPYRPEAGEGRFY